MVLTSNKTHRMKYLFMLTLLFALRASKAQLIDFSKYPVYTGKDLGLSHSSSQSVFKIWSPPASAAQLIFYKEGVGGEAMQVIDMVKKEGGVWQAIVKGDQQGKFYVFRVQIDGKWQDEVPDPYAKMVGVNGKRAYVADLSSTNPPGWSTDKSPAFKNKTDAIIYELHIRDASIHSNSGIMTKGKFLGLAESGTKNEDGLSTGLDHLKELGVTHIHLLPFYDYFTVDESKLDKAQYNWGYDPLNYNVPEGSYSTNPYDGTTRIRELKKMIQAFHKNGLRVVMDVVYNHTMFAEKSYLNQLVPGYYYRQKPDGSFSDATACGNETASERAMMRKFILESVHYWVREFHIDGFRFDLMGVHDIETMNLISKELHKIKPDILLYGEGWTAGGSPLPDSLRALKKNAHRLDRIAVFSDDIRDGIKGSVFDHRDRGFASGKKGMDQSIRFGIVAACKHPQVDYKNVNYSKAPYAKWPHQVISYCECHDNHVLWDKLAISATGAGEEERREMHKLSLSIVFTSQGISFLHAGTEFLRSKQGNENSFNAGDSINAIDWSLKSKNKDVFDYVKALIQLRKNHPAFRMTSAEQIANNIRFVDTGNDHLVAYTINGAAVADSWKKILVVLNGGEKAATLILPAGNWQVFSEANRVSAKKVSATKQVEAQAYSCSIYYLK
jgi:pullulanase